MFLFVSGIMVGLRIESREDRGWGPRKRMFDVLKRAGCSWNGRNDGDGPTLGTCCRSVS